jgi:hypothetical protein
MRVRGPSRAQLFSCIAAVCAVYALLPACSKPLLAPTDERSVFDRYDAVRGEFAQQYIEDEFGARKPNLRARLGPKQ